MFSSAASDSESSACVAAGPAELERALTGRSEAASGSLTRWDLWMAGLCGALLAVLALSLPAHAGSPPLPEKDWTRTETRADCAGYSALKNPYFGDMHVHTKYSADSVLARNRSTVRDAYSFAKGATIGLAPYDAFDNPGRLATIDRPLDFMAVTDHSEGFGEAKICLNPGYAGYDDPICTDLRASFNRDFKPTNPLPFSFIQFFIPLNATNPQRYDGICGTPGWPDCATESGLVWQDTQDAAAENYDLTSECKFTTFVGYEWSGNTNGNNLHRNVIFRNSHVPALPISYYEQWKPEGLWAQLQSQCIDAGNGCDVLAIPHNSNIGGGQLNGDGGMFSKLDSDGQPLTALEASLRASFEPIMELFQIKGDSECRDGVSGTTDELCNFEKLSRDTLIGTSLWTRKFSPYAYARGALKRGLDLESQIGVNPFALGFIGGTDTHNGVGGGVSEIDYGKIGFSGIADSEPAFILAEATPPSKIQSNGGGLSVVWAEENSRDAIFSALRRRETYSTSGTRPVVRSFAGRYPSTLCADPNFVAEGYDKGVPMGGDIGPVRGKSSPRFAILAQMDAGTLTRPGTPLQRIQVVKGWIDPASGETLEKVYDVAGDAKSGATVNEASCEESGPGNTQLCTVWEDPKFKPAENAFYYVRVLENPVCRWSQRLCNELKTCSVHLKSCSKDTTRICTTDTECSDYDAGSTCTVDYPAICTRNEDCEHLGAGTCGVTPAVDCSNPASLPPGAIECCDSHIPHVIQERAVASPIWYHADRVGITKGQVLFGKTTGTDKLQLALLIGRSPAALDPKTQPITITLSDEASVWSVTIPAATMQEKKPGAVYQFKDKTGANNGLTDLQIKISKGTATLKLKAGNRDLAGLARAAARISVQLEAGTDYSSTAVNDWAFKDPKLSATF